jgi:hypothetical protein
MSRRKVTLESLVRDYFSTHSAPPEFPEDLVSNREDCQEVQAALEGIRIKRAENLLNYREK